jgi:ribA/ribD-fused uncharacterized protein
MLPRLSSFPIYHNPPIGTIDSFSGPYAFLSNFYAHPVKFEGDMHPTNEHAFQAAKTYGLAERERIRQAPSLASAKTLGRRVKLRLDREEVKYAITLGLVRAKFADEPLRSALLTTGSAELIEGNHWRDRTWGCTCDSSGKRVEKN